jgi:hypothetical protein
MSVRIQIIDPRRTFAVQVYSRNTERRSRHIWVAIHPQGRDWASVFCNALNLLMEASNVDQQRISFSEGAGQIAWRRAAFWTIIRLDMITFSRKKRQLIASGLLHSARYTD